MEAGSILMFAGTTAPSGYLVCDGSAVSRTTYATLFGIIGTTYGTGDGSTTFNLPDLSGRVTMGVSSGYALAATGGEETHQLLTTEIPGHTHGIPSHGHAHTIKATTPKFVHSITQPAFTYNKPNSTVSKQTYSSNSGGYAGTSSTAATRSTNVAITAHAAAACTMSGSITDRDSFNTNTKGSGTAHQNMQPFITMNYIICTGE